MQTVELLKKKLWDEFIQLNPKGKLAAIPVNDSEWPEIQIVLDKKLRQLRIGFVIDAVCAGTINLILWTIFFLKYFDTDTCVVIGDKWLLFFLISTGTLTIFGRCRMYVKYQRLQDVVGTMAFLCRDNPLL